MAISKFDRDYILQSDIFTNATPEAQAKVLSTLGLTSQDLFAIREASNADSVGTDPEAYTNSVKKAYTQPEAGFIGQTARSAKRGVLNLIESTANISLYDNYVDSADNTWFDKTYSRPVKEWATKKLEDSPQLTNENTGLLNKSFQSAVESTPVSLAYGAPVIASSVIPIAGSVIGGAASFEAMRRSTTVEQIDALKKQLAQKGITNIPDSKVIEIAKQQGLSEAGTELASDIVTATALKFIDPTKGVLSTTGTTFLKNLFQPELKQTAKQLGKAYLGSATGEVSTELANLGIQQKLGEELGLENQFWKQAPETALSTLFMSGGMTAVGGSVAISKRNKELQKVQDLVFNGLDSVDQMNEDQLSQYKKARLTAAQALVPTIESTLGEDAANNFATHVVNATKVAVDPTIEATGELPFNGSIFTATLDNTATVHTNEDVDILNPLNNKESLLQEAIAANQQLKVDQADSAALKYGYGASSDLESKKRVPYGPIIPADIAQQRAVQEQLNSGTELGKLLKSNPALLNIALADGNLVNSLLAQANKRDQIAAIFADAIAKQKEAPQAILGDIIVDVEALEQAGILQSVTSAIPIGATQIGEQAPLQQSPDAMGTLGMAGTVPVKPLEPQAASQQPVIPTSNQLKSEAEAKLKQEQQRVADVTIAVRGMLSTTVGGFTYAPKVNKDGTVSIVKSGKGIKREIPNLTPDEALSFLKDVEQRSVLEQQQLETAKLVKQSQPKATTQANIPTQNIIPKAVNPVQQPVVNTTTTPVVPKEKKTNTTTSPTQVKDQEKPADKKETTTLEVYKRVDSVSEKGKPKTEYTVETREVSLEQAKKELEKRKSVLEKFKTCIGG